MAAASTSAAAAPSMDRDAPSGLAPGLPASQSEECCANNRVMHCIGQFVTAAPVDAVWNNLLTSVTSWARWFPVRDATRVYIIGVDEKKGNQPVAHGDRVAVEGSGVARGHAVVQNTIFDIEIERDPAKRVMRVLAPHVSGLPCSCCGPTRRPLFHFQVNPNPNGSAAGTVVTVVTHVEVATCAQMCLISAWPCGCIIAGLICCNIGAAAAEQQKLVDRAARGIADAGAATAAAAKDSGVDAAVTTKAAAAPPAYNNASATPLMVFVPITAPAPGPNASAPPA